MDVIEQPVKENGIRKEDGFTRRVGFLGLDDE
jgi:hypothetical protein